MSREYWLNLIYGAKATENSDTLVLEPACTQAELFQAEKALGKPLPLAAKAALDYWNERGSQLLVDDLPKILNPLAAYDQLNPTGRDMRTLFPVFCQMLDNTEQFAVLVNPRHHYDNLKISFAGSGKCLITEHPSLKDWAFNMPHTLETLFEQEAELAFALSPQLKQLLLRANGGRGSSCPYFTPIEYFDKGLLGFFYEGIGMADWLDAEIFKRMNAFVTLYQDGCGNEHGFFCDETSSDGEYRIYNWDHETCRFTVWTSNFAEWFNQFLLRGW